LPGGPARSPTPATTFVCRANDQAFPAGGFACLILAGSKQLSRCDTVLNSPSWTKVQEGCPGAGQPDVVPDSNGTPVADPRRLIERLRNAL